jgi:hypothetical protein
MTSPSETATDHEMVREDDRDIFGGISVRAGPPAVENPQPPASFPVRDMEPDVEPDAGPASIPSAPAASHTARADWHEILAMFVDDPHASAELAASTVDYSVQALAASIKEQQDSLLSAWHGEGAGTEELRTAVQQYRAFWNRLEDFSQRNVSLRR